MLVDFKGSQPGWCKCTDCAEPGATEVSNRFYAFPPRLNSFWEPETTRLRAPTTPPSPQKPEGQKKPRLASLGKVQCRECMVFRGAISGSLDGLANRVVGDGYCDWRSSALRLLANAIVEAIAPYQITHSPTACLQTMSSHDAGFKAALAEARQGSLEGGVPIGAALVSAEGTILGRGHNLRLQKASATLHVCIPSLQVHFLCSWSDHTRQKYPPLKTRGVSQHRPTAAQPCIQPSAHVTCAREHA